MKSSLDIIKGAVAKQDLVSLFKAIHSYDNRIQANNGRFAIDAPFKHGIDFTVPASTFINAIDHSSDKRKVSIKDKQLFVKDKDFLVQMAMLPDEFPLKIPDGKKKKINVDLLSLLKLLRPFIGTDVTRIWSNGILLKNNFAYVTNNIVVARIRFEVKDTISIPVYIIDEILRLDKQPTHIQIGKNDLTFYFDDKSWICGQQISMDWPDQLDEIIDNTEQGDKLPSGINEAMDKLSYFLEDVKITLSENSIYVGSGTTKAEVKQFSFPESAFNFESLREVFKKSTHFSCSEYPAPCPFYNEENALTGVIVGMR